MKSTNDNDDASNLNNRSLFNPYKEDTKTTPKQLFDPKSKIQGASTPTIVTNKQNKQNDTQESSAENNSRNKIVSKQLFDLYKEQENNKRFEAQELSEKSPRNVAAKKLFNPYNEEQSEHAYESTDNQG